ncbi:uncharacterized protein C6orf136 homolog isoform X2 [Strigops habroptila]|uniref:uncharacterized protein C6orf136 homolog isoform X2 n=1 Tax=Strigops habroptila TaxID=2489341 RepID=UPI0011CF3CFA|nr:uncharacterized protein C6orf136 homolog isoform X2 [Strigops habroptila]
MGQLHPHVVVPSSYGAAPSPYGAAAPLWGSSILLWGSSIPMVQLHPPMGQILLYGAAPPLWGSSPSMGQLCPSMGSSIPLWGSSPSMGQLHPHCPTPARPPLSTGHPQDLDPPLGHVPALPPPAPRPPLALSPPEGLGGAITTVDGRREDDIAVRDGPGAAVLLLLRPPAPLLRPAGPPRRAPPTMEEHLAVMHQKLQDELPNFFLKIPDYGLYSHDVEFINHLLHLHTRSYDAFSTFFLNSQGLIRCHRVDKLMPAPTPLTEDKKLLVAAAVAALSAQVTHTVAPLHFAVKPSATPGDP